MHRRKHPPRLGRGRAAPDPAPLTPEASSVPAACRDAIVFAQEFRHGKVAFLGLGVMGYPMARHLASKGHEVTVYNRTFAKAEKWVGETRRQGRA